MKRRFKLNNLGCANCASKMETAIAKIDGVNSVTLNFMTQSMILDADGDLFDKILEESERICKKIEPDFVLIR